MTIYEYMEDFDNPEVSSIEWEDKMIEAVQDYNEENQTAYDPYKTINQYKRWQINKAYETD